MIRLRNLLLLPMIAFAFQPGSAEGADRFSALEGAYLGQKPPGLSPEVFAPGIISTDVGEGCSGFMSDGNLFLFSRRGRGILITERREKGWTMPRKAPFAVEGQDGDFIVAPDGKTIYFASGRPLSRGGEPLKDHNIWRTVRTKSGWTEPEPLGPAVNTDAHESYPSLSDSGTLYYFGRGEGGFGQSDIYRAELVDGRYERVRNLGDVINTKYHEVDPFIAPDESYLIFASDRPGGFGSDDFYISFKNRDGDWLPPMNMGEEFNSPHTEYILNVTLDGKYIFFTSDKSGNRDIYWVDSKILYELRKKDSSTP